MKYLLILLFSLSMMFFIVSCENSTEPAKSSPTSGIIKFKVVSQENISIKGATIKLLGTSYVAISDSLGEVEFDNIPFDRYTASAYIKNIGSGRITVDFQSVTQNFVIPFNYGLLNEPNIKISNPYNNFMSFGDSIFVPIQVTDNFTPSDSIKVTVKIDDSNFEYFPDETGKLNFSFHLKKRGSFNFQVVAVDNENEIAIDSFTIKVKYPQKIKLNSQITDTSVILNWTQISDPDIEYIQIKRTASKDYYFTITDLSLTEFIDYNIPIEDEVKYSLKLVDKYGESSISNEVLITEPYGKLLQVNIVDVVKHPTLPQLIIFTTTNKLILYDYKKRIIINDVIVNHSANYIEIGNAGYGMEIFIPDKSGNIKIYDAATLNFKKNIYVQVEVRSVVVNGYGHIFASHKKYYDGLRVYDRDTGRMLVSLPGTDCLLRKVPKQDIIVSIPIKDTFGEVRFHGYNKELTKVFTVAGSVYASGNNFKISPDGKYLISSSNRVVKIEQYPIHAGSLKYLNYSLVDFAFSENSSLIFTTHPSNKIVVYSYPTLKFEYDLLSKGLPTYLFFDEGLFALTYNKDRASYFIEKYK